MNPDQYIFCEEHNEYVKPFWSERNKEWYAICKAGDKDHFLKINDDVEFDRSHQNQFDPDYQVEHTHE